MHADCHSRRRLHPMTREFPSPSTRRLLRRRTARDGQHSEWGRVSTGCLRRLKRPRCGALARHPHPAASTRAPRSRSRARLSLAVLRDCSHLCKWGTNGPRASRTSRRLRRARCPPLEPVRSGRSRRPRRAEARPALLSPSRRPTRTEPSPSPHRFHPPRRCSERRCSSPDESARRVTCRACERPEAPPAARSAFC